MVARGGEFTPTPAISRAILVYNRGRSSGLADGIVMTPSHNPPGDGGYKYNPPNGGPADTDVTGWIEKRANVLLAGALTEVKRVGTGAGRLPAQSANTTSSGPTWPTLRGSWTSLRSRLPAYTWVSIR